MLNWEKTKIKTMKAVVKRIKIEKYAGPGLNPTLS